MNVEGKAYAGLTIKFAQGMDGFQVVGFINPNSSRNLEPDAAKQITDPDEIARLDRKTSGQK